ncbi:extracellular serine-rich protein [Podospora didyma]|uniref:Extracellular serine-rich protein n=1 Tax=Podospora didyma TaxID=330526 RepID=A0AAE0U3W3_9PEZI|nr:extracellular serine-rich protein [Podospora didyma]
MMFVKTLAIGAALVAHAAAVDIRIDVGLTPLTFTPNTTTAKVGDYLEYHFHTATQHSVVAGDFASPCTPAKTGGFYSGFFSTTGTGENPNVFRVLVNTTDPIFFYCSYLRHCENGMVGVVNPGSQTLAAYKSSAASASGSVSPPGVFGGVVTTANSSSSTPSSSTSSAPATSSTAPPSAGGGGNGAGSLAVSFVSLLGAVGAAILMI